jgi:2'-5' RNA ligase
MYRAGSTEETALFNLAIIPPTSTAREIIRLSAQAAARGGTFSVDGLSKRPHLTVYMARFEARSVDQLIGRLEELFEESRSIDLSCNGYYVTPGGYYEISYERTSALLALHEDAIACLSPLRFSAGNPVVEEYFAPYSEEQQHRAGEFGYDLSFDLYRPHITLTRFRSLVPVELPTADIDLSFAAFQVGLFEADHLGAIGKNISTWTLS